MARRKFTPEELAQIEGYGAIRLPIDRMAPLFGFKSESDFREVLKKHPAARQRLELGWSKSSAKFRKTLYEQVTVEKNPRLMEFWAKTQEGFKMTEVIEHRGSISTGLDTERLKEIFGDPEKLELARALAESLSKPKDKDGRGNG